MQIPVNKKPPPNSLVLRLAFPGPRHQQRQALSDFRRWARGQGWTEPQIRACLRTLTRTVN